MGGRSRFSFNGFAHSCGGFFPCHDGFFFRHRFHDNFFFLFGSSFFPFGSPFFGSPFFGSPFFPGFVGASYIPGFSPQDYYPPYPAQPPAEMVSNDNSADIQLAQQIQRLSDEVEDLRDEQATARRETRETPPPGTSMSAVNPAVATTFVFRDGRRTTAQNYAIAGETLWILNEHAAKKVPLSDIDVAATEQVNAANGVNVRLPGSSQKK